MPKANVPRKSGSIMSYFEPVKLPKKLAKLDQAELDEKSAFLNNKKINQSIKQKKESAQATSTTPKMAHLDWVLQGTLLKTRFQPLQQDIPKEVAVAAFDLDSTLVDTKSHTPFPRNGSDWRWLSSKVKPALIRLASTTDDSTQPEETETTSMLSEVMKSPCPRIIVIFSNQGGVVAKPDAKRFQYIKERIAQIALDLNTPFWFYGATKEPKTKSPSDKSYRKPAVGMWLQFQKELEELGVVLDTKNSFFVGDAAGRAKDFSDSDMKFALSIGLPFYTPEDFF